MRIPSRGIWKSLRLAPPLPPKLHHLTSGMGSIMRDWSLDRQNPSVLTVCRFTSRSVHYITITQFGEVWKRFNLTLLSVSFENRRRGSCILQIALMPAGNSSWWSPILLTGRWGYSDGKRIHRFQCPFAPYLCWTGLRIVLVRRALSDFCVQWWIWGTWRR